MHVWNYAWTDLIFSTMSSNFAGDDKDSGFNLAITM